MTSAAPAFDSDPAPDSAPGSDRTKPVRLAPSDVLRLGLLGIRTRRMRAALSALGISIGIATLILVTGIPASSQRDLNAQLSALGTNTLRAEPQPNQSPPVLLPENADESAARIGPVTVASSVANTHALVRRSDRTDPQDGSGLTVLAAKSDLLPAVNGKIRSGRFLNASTERFPTVVLGYRAASASASPGWCRARRHRRSSSTTGGSRSSASSTSCRSRPISTAPYSSDGRRPVPSWASTATPR